MKRREKRKIQNPGLLRLHNQGIQRSHKIAQNVHISIIKYTKSIKKGTETKEIKHLNLLNGKRKLYEEFRREIGMST